jgi:hypothetical protein
MIKNYNVNFVNFINLINNVNNQGNFDIINADNYHDAYSNLLNHSCYNLESFLVS